MAVFKFRNLKTGQAMPIPPGQYMVGRADEAYIHLEDPSVSRKHARLSNTEHGFFVEDLNSVNGTALRGAYIKGRAQLEMGEVVYVGSVPFRVDPEVSGEPESTTSTGIRALNRAYLSRDTERIPLTRGSLPRLEPLAAAEDPAAKGEAKPADETNQSIAPKLDAANPVALEARSLLSSPVIAEPVATGPAPQSVLTESQKEGQGTSLWWIVAFVAGLGLGVLLGLFLARLYLESGGSLRSLP